MIVKLLTEHYLELLSLKGGCSQGLQRLVRVYTCQNVKLFEISCHGSISNIYIKYILKLESCSIAEIQTV